MCAFLTCAPALSQVIGEAKMASKDVEMTGKNNPNNSMNDKRDYEVEECVSFPPQPHPLGCPGARHQQQGQHQDVGLKEKVILPAGSTPATPSLHSFFWVKSWALPGIGMFCEVGSP